MREEDHLARSISALVIHSDSVLGEMFLNLGKDGLLNNKLIL